MHRIANSITLSFFTTLLIFSQGVPPSIQYNISVPIPEIELYLPDSLVEKSNQQNTLQKRAISGWNLKVDITPFNSGLWTEIKGVGNIWQISVYAHFAGSVALALNDIDLKEGSFYFYPPPKTPTYGPVSKPDFFKSKYYSNPIEGERIVIEYFTKFKPSKIPFKITDVVYGFNQNYIENAYSKSTESCNIDINCPEGIDWQIEKRSVCKIKIHHIGGSIEDCTGTLINNTSGQLKAYIVTAYHCIEHETQASNSQFIFGYEKDICNGSDGKQNLSIMGSKYLTSNYKRDYTLVELSQLPPFTTSPYYAGWSADTTNITSTAGIHHPGGWEKKISIDNDKPGIDDTFFVENNTIYNKRITWSVYKWEKGITEKGSSGSPLFNNNKKYIGLLSRGESRCIPYSQLYDNYIRFDAMYNDAYDNYNFKKYLNPHNDNTIECSGFDPYQQFTASCDTYKNYTIIENLLTLPNNKGGFISGTNGDSISVFAEKFYSYHTSYITGAYFSTAINTCNSDAYIIVRAWSGQTQPDSLLSERLVPISKFIADKRIFVDFYPLVKTNGNIFISYELRNINSGEFALYQTPLRSYLNGYMYLFYNNKWITINNYLGSQTGSSQSIEVVLCYESLDSIEKVKKLELLQVYPNPAKNQISFLLPESDKKAIFIQVFDIRGAMYSIQFKWYEKNIYEADISSLKTGMYFIKIRLLDSEYNIRFIIN